MWILACGCGGGREINARLRSTKMLRTKPALTLLGWLALCAAGVAQPVPICPTMINPPGPHPFIVRGSPAYDEVSVVWIATQSSAGNQTYLCSGTLIGANRVLTAAHCVCPGCSMFVGMGPLVNAAPTDRIVAKVLGVSLHPAYLQSGAAMQPGSDLAVLTIESYSSCPQYKQPLPIFPISAAAANATGRFSIVGYGLTELGPNSAGEKRKADVVASSVTCTQPWSRRDGCVAFREFVLEGSVTLLDKTLGADTCNGDSGGPALIVDNTGHKFLAGTTSRALIPKGGFNNEGCGFGGIYEYAGIPTVLQWLSTVVPDLQLAAQ